MEICLISECMRGLDFDKVLAAYEELNIHHIEIGCGGWSKGIHIDLNGIVSSQEIANQYIEKLVGYEIRIAALNCSGNQLSPATGQAHNEIVLKAFKAAERLGVDRVVMMSGLPGGPGDMNPNWIVTQWPEEVYDVLEYQWNEVAIPYWNQIIKIAYDCGIKKIAIELHGGQLVYSAATFQKLKASIDDTHDMVGINLDPSHLIWMGADPIRIIRELSTYIYHVHIKDTRFNPDMCALNTVLDTTSGREFSKRAWNPTIPGRGKDERWWSTFIEELKWHGYDDVLSIEMDAHTDDTQFGIKKAIQFLKRIIE